jgi:hypothetical protein
MSTERKPGSRGVRMPSTLERINQPPRDEAARESKRTPKGTTKTVSPRRSFKRKRGK